MDNQSNHEDAASRATKQRQHRLAEKLQQNAQRRRREQYLAELPQPLAEQLTSAACWYTPELDTFRAAWYPVGPDGCGEPQRQPTGYHYEVVYWREQAVACVKELGIAYDNEEAVLLSWWEGYPGFLVPFGWARQHLAELLRGDWIALVHVDLAVGFVIDHYATGPADKNPNPKEDIAFEVAWWR